MLLVFYSFYFSDMGFLPIIIDCVYNITHPLSLRIMGDHALDQDVAVNVSVDNKTIKLNCNVLPQIIFGFLRFFFFFEGHTTAYF